MDAGLKARDKFFYGWIIVITGMIISAILIGSRQSYGVFFTSIENDFGLNRAATAGVFSVYMALSAVFAAVGGWALDRFGPRVAIAAMGLFYRSRSFDHQSDAGCLAIIPGIRPPDGRRDRRSLYISGRFCLQVVQKKTRSGAGVVYIGWGNRLPGICSFCQLSNRQP